MLSKLMRYWIYTLFAKIMSASFVFLFCELLCIYMLFTNDAVQKKHARTESIAAEAAITATTTMNAWSWYIEMAAIRWRQTDLKHVNL